MPRPLRIQIRADRFAQAVHALEQARRCWHRMDAALVVMKPHEDLVPEAVAAWEALGELDRHLDRLTDLLVR